MTQDDICNWQSIGELFAAALDHFLPPDPDKEAIRAASIARNREIDDV